MWIFWSEVSGFWQARIKVARRCRAHTIGTTYRVCQRKNKSFSSLISQPPCLQVAPPPPPRAPAWKAASGWPVRRETRPCWPPTASQQPATSSSNSNSRPRRGRAAAAPTAAPTTSTTGTATLPATTATAAPRWARRMHDLVNYNVIMMISKYLVIISKRQGKKILRLATFYVH